MIAEVLMVSQRASVYIAEVSGPSEMHCLRTCALHCDFRARSPECEVNCFAKPGKMWNKMWKHLWKLD